MKTVGPKFPKIDLFCFHQNPGESESQCWVMWRPCVNYFAKEDFSLEDSFQQSCKNQPSLLKVGSLYVCSSLSISIPTASKIDLKQLFVTRD